MLKLVAVPVALVLAGAAVVLLMTGSTAGTAAAMALLGVIAVGVVSLIFLAVGRSEDRDRAEAEAARRERAGPPREPNGSGEPERIARDRRRPLPPRRGH